MRLPLAAWLVTGGFCFFTLTASRAQTTASSPTVWRLNDLQALGGTAVTVVGHPQIVEEPWGKVTHFDGTADGLFLPINPLAGLSEFTLEILFKPETGGPAEQRFFHIQDQASNRGLLEIRLIDAQWALDSFLYAAKPESRCTLLDRTKLHPANQWTWVALV